MIRVLLLGSPAVYQDDQPLQIARRLQRSLLYYLACHPEPVSRAELAIMFWPEDDDAGSRRHLREAISKLHAALPDESIWIQSNENIGLDHSRVYVDVIHFQRLLTRVWRNVIQVPTHLPLPNAVFNEIRQALGMWRGTHFLSGANLPSKLELEHWYLHLAQDLEYSLQRLQERLAFHHAATGDLEAAVYWLRQALLSDELNEALHHQVLEWIQRTGRRSELLKAIRAMRELYRREAGGLPDSLESLCRRLEQPTAQKSLPPSPWPDSRGLEIPFVGRSEQLRVLRQAYHTGGWLIVTGEAGAGKTRLLRQFTSTLDPAPRLFYICAHSETSSLPFQPVVEMLRQAVTREDWLELGATWGMHLALLLPELTELWPRLPEPPAVEVFSARAVLFEALRRLVLMLARDRPVLFILDDAQWSDEATLDALAYLDETGVFSGRGLLVVAARSEARSQPLDRFLSRPRRPAHSRLEVLELTAGEIAEVTRYALGQTPPDELVEKLSTGTGGNPLFLLETLRAWLDTDSSPNLSPSVETLPLVPNLRDLLRERMHGFSEEKRSVLNTAAVIGHEFTPAVLEAASGQPTERLVALLEDLERDHLIAPAASSEQPQGYVFIHDQLRELLVQDLSPARRRMLNMRVADALEGAAAAQTHQQAATLAEFRETAGQELEAYRLWLRAAAHAQRMYASTEAYAAYRRASRLVERMANRLNDDDLTALFSNWAELAYDINDPETLQAAYTRLLSLGEERGSAQLVGTALSGLASGRGLRGDFNGAMELIDQAGPYLEKCGDLYERILARIRRGRFLMMLNRNDAATACFREAATEPPGADPRVQRLIVRAHSLLSQELSQTGHPRPALVTGETALRLSRLYMEPTSEARSRISLVLSNFYLGHYAEALEHYRIAMEMGQAAIGSLRMGMIRAISARCHLVLGNYDTAWKEGTTALEYGKKESLPMVTGEAYCLIGDLFRYFGRLETAVEYYQGGLQSVNPYFFLAMEIRWRLGATLALMGQVETGREYIRASQQFAHQTGLGTIEYYASTYLAGVEIRAGELDAAEERLAECSRVGQERGLAIVTARCSLLSIQLQRARGNREEALHLAKKADIEMQALGAPILELRVCEELYSLQQESGLPAEGTRQRGLALLDRLGHGATHPAIRPAFLAYQAAILQRNSWS